ncbi:MAG: LPXTG cell wall anchor domain-containing protein [Clostridium sp.]|nr:LPXTG cell wall anchor domain-containing protein [Clostridium sp.]
MIQEEIKDTSNEIDTNEKKPQEDNKVDKILNEYLEDIYDSEEALSFRKELVSKHKLEDKVDENFFFKDEYINKLIDLETIGDCIVLVDISKKDLALKYLQDENVDPILESMNNLNPIRTRFRRSLPLISARTGMTVTNHGNLTYYEGGILMGQSDMFSINGRTAFCADHSKLSPHTGVRILGTSVEGNSDIRKILYYGFEGPGQIGGWASNGLRIATALAISEVRHGDGRNLGKRLLNQVRGLPEPPSSFTAYIADTEGSSYQDLAFWMYNPKGSLQISKSSADPSITNGNNYYSIAGAEYGVFKNSNATGQVATLTIGSNGWSQEIQLDSGTYYIKETKAPKGYALDRNIYPITVNSGSKAVGNYKDKPQFDPVGVLLRKVDSDTGANKPQGNGSLADAHFTFKFYAGEYRDGVNPADLGVSPTRTWIMRTDEFGFTMLDNSYKVSGDDLYIVNGSPTLPLGTITIQETKAPTGYKINSEIFVRRITPNGAAESVNTYNEPIIKEDSLDFTIRKVQEGTHILLPNIKFRHTKPNGTTEELTTNPNGEIVIKGLEQGTHKIIEISTTETIRVISNTTNMGMSYVESEGNGVLTVENSLRPFQLKVVKVNDKNTPLKGAEFTLYSDRECRNEISKAVSNEQGELFFDGLKVGTEYYFKETKAPEGYRIPVDADGNVHVYEVVTESQPSNGIFNFTIDGVKYTANSTNGDIHIEGNKNDRVISVKVVNYITMKLPSTGSGMMIPILVVGMSLMGVAIIMSRKSKKENKR